jgi:hypothetical protein
MDILASQHFNTKRSFTMARFPKHAAAIESRIAVEDVQQIAARRANAAAVRDLKERRGEAESRLAYFEKAHREGRLTRENHDGDTITMVADLSPVTEVKDELANIDAQIERLEPKESQRRMTAARLRSQIDSKGRYVSNVVQPSIREGESAKAALARVRATIDGERDEREAVVNAPRTIDEVRERARAMAASLAARGVPKVLPAFRGGDIELPKVQVPNPGNPNLTFVPDGVAFVAWLFQAELEKRIDQLVEFNADDDALTASEQTERLQSIDERLTTLYRDEAAIVEAIVVAEGGSAFHFADRPVECVLGIRRA